MTKRPGYYVNGKFYGFKLAQAMGHARHCAELFGRLVDVELIDHAGRMTVERSVAPGARIAA